MSAYDAWLMTPPYDDEPEVCECGESGCTCAQDAEDERGDALYHAMKDNQHE